MIFQCHHRYMRFNQNVTTQYHIFFVVTDQKLYTYQFLYLLVEEMSVKPSNGNQSGNKVRSTLSVFLTLFFLFPEGAGQM